MAANSKPADVRTSVMRNVRSVLLLTGQWVSVDDHEAVRVSLTSGEGDELLIFLSGGRAFAIRAGLIGGFEFTVPGEEGDGGEGLPEGTPAAASGPLVVAPMPAEPV